MANEVEDIKSRLDIVDIIQEYLPMKKAGSNHKGLCPFHQEKTPSFMASQAKQIWHCFGCHEGGDIFSFVQKMEGIDFYESLKLLGEKAGVRIVKRQAKQTDKKQVLLEILELSAQFFNKILCGHPKAQVARDYFKSRRVTDETVKKFQLGYAPDSWEILYKFLLSKGYKQQDILDSGMVVFNRERNSVYDRFRHRIIIPLSDAYGNVVGFTARALGDDYQGGKYINTPQTEVYDKSRVVFGLNHAKQAIKAAGYVVIVEGNMDVIASHQAGVLPVVAVSGTALTEQQIGLIRRFTKTCVFAFDADAAGLLAARRGVELALQADMEVKILSLPTGKDPDDCIRQDKQLWVQAIADAKPVIEHLIIQGANNNDTYTPEGKKAVAADVVPLLGFLVNSVERDHFVQQLAGAINVSAHSIYEMLKQNKIKEVYDDRILKQGPLTQKKDPEEEAGMGILSLLISDPTLLAEVEVDPEWFSNNQFKDLYKNIEIFYDKYTGKENNSGKFFEYSKTLTTSQQSLITHLQLYRDKEFPSLSSLESRDALKARIKFLQRRNLQRELRKIKIAIKQAEDRGDFPAVQDLSVQFGEVSKQLSDN